MVRDPRPARTVHSTDALGWLRAAGVIAGASVVTSLPDVSELKGMTTPDWRAWFRAAAALVIAACPEDGVAIFYQTDVISDGQWQDKGYLVQRGAEDAGARLLFHRIACREDAHLSHWGRPAYSHLIGVSRALVPRRNLARTDVLPTVGEMLWSKAIGLAACADAVRFVRDHTTSTMVLDPFCGQGTVLAVANALGLDAVGVELVPRRAQAARNLRVALP